MLCTVFSLHGSLAFLVSCLLFLNPVSTVFEDSDFLGDSKASDVLSVMKDELQNLRMDLTKSFVAEHTRRKRAATGRIEARISKDNPEFAIGIDSLGQTTASFKDDLLVFKVDGIFRVDKNAQLEKVSEWALEQGDTILNTYVWSDQLFILTTNKKGSYSRLSTLEAPGFTLIPRQQIKMSGIAKAAQFFHHGQDLYLIIAVDNEQHSLATSPIYRWTRTYMDQIHQIETRGASAVTAFPVNSYTYIAIAQSQDAAGNFQVGTILVRMFEKGEVEKVQLLWTNNPISLKHFRIFQEDYLLIGQFKESSIIYWFGGFDFTYWETEGHFGKSHFLDTLILSDNEPLILSGNDQTVKFITRESSTYSGELVFNQTNTVYTVKATETLVNARFIQLQNGQNYLALTVQNSGMSTELKVFKITTFQVQEGESQVKDPEDKVTTCLTRLKTKLDQDEPSIISLEKVNDLIITRTKDINFRGAIIVPTSTIVVPAKDSLIDRGLVQPDLNLPEDKYSLTPSQLIALAEKQAVEFATDIQPRLDNVLLKSVPGNITGDKTFTKPLIINDLNLSKLQLQTLNQVAWSDLENRVLQIRSDRNQIISGDWVIENLKSAKFLGVNQIGDIIIDDFLLTNCESGVVAVQTTRSDYIFNDDLEFKDDLSLGGSAMINQIKFSDIALRSRLGGKEIRGTKQADFIVGSDGFEALLLNGVNMKEWFESMMHIDGDEQISTGLKTFSNLNSIEEAKVENVNGQNWNQFLASIILSDTDQTISGDVQFKRLVATKLFTEEINSKRIDELLTKTTDQVVTSDILISDLKFRKNLETGTVNGIAITDAVRKSEDAEIHGPVHFRQLSVNDVLVNDGIMISNVDVSEAAKLRKTHTYTTTNSEAIHIKTGEVGANVMEATTLNGVDIEKIKEAFWRLDVQNEIPEDFDFTPAGLVTVGELTTKTLNQLRLDRDIVTTTGENEEILANLQFDRTVFVFGDVITRDGVEINEFDISKMASQIIRTDGTTERHITGQKRFLHTIDAKNGMDVRRVNNKNLESDFVRLRGVSHQKITGQKKFQEVSAQNVLSTTDIIVNGLVNGHDLKKVRDTTAYSDQPVTIVGDVIFSKSVEAKSLRVENEVNRRRFNEIVAQRIDLSQEQKLAIPLTIQEGTLTFKEDSIVNFINGIRPAEYLAKVVNKNADVVISGAKEFDTVIIEEDLDGCRTINGIDFLDLERFAFSKTSDQIITGKFQFEQVHSTDNLKTDRIGGILLSNLAQTNEASEVGSTVIFEGAETSFQDIQVNGLVNKVKIEEVAAGLRKLSGDRRFRTVTVERNLNWENSHNEFKLLSYLFDKAVTRDTDQTITDKITFSSLKANSIESEQWINGVDLKFIRDDAVFENEPVTFTGRNSFSQTFVSDRSVQVNKVLNADFINTVSLKALSGQVVQRDSTDQLITGLKTFEQGFTTENLFVGGSIDSIRAEDIVLKGDKRIIDRLTLDDVKINGNLDFEKLDGFPSISELLAQLVSLSEIQTIRGSDFTFDKNVDVDECDASLINDIRDSDLFLKDSTFQKVRGQKTFQKLIIDGSVQQASLNGIFLDHLNSQIFRLDQNEVFERHVIFSDTVLVKDMNVTNGINKIDFGQVEAQFSTQLKDIVAPIHATKETRDKALESIKSLKESLKNEAFWFNTGLLPSHYFGTSAIRVEHLVNPKEKLNKISLQQRVSVGEGSSDCDLPTGCFCKLTQVWELQPDTKTESSPLALKTDEFRGVNAFHKLSPSGTTYFIQSPVVSYNEICTSPTEEGITRVSTISSANIKLVGEVSTGFITDAQVFSSYGTDYIILSQSFDHLTQSHAADVLVFAIGYSGLEKVQSLPANGATRLALESKYDGWVLAVANSLDGLSPEDCSTDSKIYFWSSEEKLFKEIKSVDTVGAEDVVILNVDHNSQYGDSFVVFAGNEGSTDNLERILGKLSIYGSRGFGSSGPKYNLVQTVTFPTSIFATYAISIRRQSYIIVVTSDSILYYKYFHAEGFRRWGTVQITGARDTNVLLWNDEIFFIIASDTNSLLAKATVIGSPVDPFQPSIGHHPVPIF